ncbi:acyl transferase [Maribacter sp. 2307ULW6-5]|uniref:LuxE/PaaK family acyltransferase n=1 Tax=Maribacter sp. 2307ULW6-5 TaxID=3386275 RepID=UPI0039BC36D0
MMAQRNFLNIDTPRDFLAQALETFGHQYAHNPVYRSYCDHLRVRPQRVSQLRDIPFLPIEFFKTQRVLTGTGAVAATFTSSGTSGQATSRHHVTDLSLYEASFTQGFAHFYGPVEDYCVLALLPSYLERQGSSLIYMANHFIAASPHPQSGFFLHDLEALRRTLGQLEAAGTKTLLLGVSFALLDLVALGPLSLEHTVVMETGGMKGRRREMIREELHGLLCQGLGVPKIHSEYGMTELLSQAYSQGDGLFSCPPWMRVLVRDTEDPFSHLGHGRSGGINIIDLANRNSCSFLATQDLGRLRAGNTFEVLGRFDHSDVRGCNLMAL